ncbi:Aldo/keto reductase [Schizopora paradoxa]|uniref:Aldo/keto reductase n=1 Tax=Schizopora paradoxa TaxID=27342 RepID=A0A0H2RLX8_9AGAM|nr:Aldo/keto reductase [Schizopora paradoxa]
MVNSTATVRVGSDEIKVAKVAHGLMMMTWKPEPTPEEECFEAIKASLDSVPAGCKMIINSGEFYGFNPRTANLELISRFFEKYPTYADKAFLSVKGGTKADTLEPDASPENLKRSVDVILEKLRGKKKLDLFECARVDRNVPIEESTKTLAGFIKEGKFDYIGTSETSAATLKRAHAVHPIAIVEVEISPWAYDEKTREVVAAAKELGVAVCAYSPLGRGYLAGKFKKLDDLHEKDFRRNMTKFKGENFEHNMAVVDGLKEIADKKGITPAQLCVAWVCSLGPNVIPLTGSSNKDRTLENLAGGDVQLSADEVSAIEKLMGLVKGDRYYGNDKMAHLME